MSEDGADRVKVLAFTSSLGLGGAEMHVLRLLNHFSPRIDATLVLSRAGGSYEKLLSPGIDVVHLWPSRLFRSSTLSLLTSVAPLRAAVRELQPDIAFSVLNHANLALLRAVGPIADPPQVVLSVQNPPESSGRQQSGLVRKMVLRSLPRAFPRADALVAISEGVREDLEGLVPGVRGRVRTIHNAGLDDTVQVRASEELPRDVKRRGDPLLVACGRLVRQKGYPYLLEALAMLAGSWPDVHLWVLGEGPDEEALERRAMELGIRDKVEFLGFRDNPFPIMGAADVFVLSSIWEGFGNVIPEAMSLGLPVVATRCEGPVEILEHGKSGMLVPLREPEALSEAVSLVLSDPSLRQRLAAGGMARAQDFHARHVARRHEELFDAVLRKKSVQG